MKRIATTIVLMFLLAYPLALGQEAKPADAPKPVAPAPKPAATPAVADDGKSYDISLNDAIQIALSNNLDVKISRYDPQKAAADIEIQKAIFDWLFFSDFSRSRNKSTSSSIINGAQGTNWNNGFSGDAGLRKLFPLGTQLELKTTGQRQLTSSPYSYFNPSYSVDATMKLTQPLLRNFGVEYNTARIAIAINSKRIAEETAKGQIVRTIYDTQAAYWNLVYAIENLRIKEHAKSLANDLLERTTTMVDKGVLPKVEITGAQARVALTDFEIITARKALGDAEDRLRAILNLANGKLPWDMHIRPTDEPRVESDKFEIGKLLQIAFDNRPDLESLRIAYKTTGINIKLAENELKPVLNAFFSIGPNGVDTEYPDVYSELDGNTYTYNAGVQFEYNFGRRKGKNQRISAILDQRKSQDSIDQLKLEITRQVYTAVRGVNSSVDGIKSSEQAVKLGQERLEVEKKKNKEGLSTNIDVIQVQDDLIKAEGQLVQARVNYNLAVIELERVLAASIKKYDMKARPEPKIDYKTPAMPPLDKKSEPAKKTVAPKGAEPKTPVKSNWKNTGETAPAKGKEKEAAKEPYDKSITSEEAMNIAEATFRYEIEHNPMKKDAPAFFLNLFEKDPDAKFLARFKDNKPRVAPGSEFQEKKGVMLRVKNITRVSANTVEVVGGYHISVIAASGHIFTLEKQKDGKWKVVKSTQKWVS